MANNITTPSQFKADVWKHFGFKVINGSKNEFDKNNAVCKLCLAAVKYCENTTNLRTHLARHHAEVLAQKQLPKRTEPNQTTLDNFLPSTSPRAQRITELIVHFICKDLRPYCVVENTGFRWMLHTLEPRYKIPQRVHIVDTAVPKMYDQVKKAVKTSLDAAQRVALTCDGWTLSVVIILFCLHSVHFHHTFQHSVFSDIEHICKMCVGIVFSFNLFNLVFKHNRRHIIFTTIRDTYRIVRCLPILTPNGNPVWNLLF